MRDYTQKYTEWEHAQSLLPEDQRSPTNPELTLSYNRARGTFFDPSSHLELNLPGELVENLLKAAKPLSHPTPTMLGDIQRHVEEMLRESLTHFITHSCRNSGRRRGMFAIVVGFAAMLVGLAPVLMSIYHHEARAVRVASLFPFWFGATTAIAGFHGVCVVIFLFGDARQLYPYELARPSLDPVSILSPMDLLPLPVTSPRKSTSSSEKEKEDGGISPGWNDRDLKSHPVVPSPTTPYPDSLPETAAFIRPDSASFSGSGTARSSTVVFDFDGLPHPIKTGTESTRGSWVQRGMFQSLTKVASPMVSRAQWEIVARSAIFAVFVALILEAIVLVVPSHS